MYCGIDIQQDLKAGQIVANQGACVAKIADPTVKSQDIAGDLRALVGYTIWPANLLRSVVSRLNGSRSTR